MSEQSKNTQSAPPKKMGTRKKIIFDKGTTTTFVLGVATTLFATWVLSLTGVVRARLSDTQVQSVALSIANKPEIRNVIINTMHESGQFVGQQGAQGHDGEKGDRGSDGADMPIGSIVGYLGDGELPDGWLLCDGRNDLSVADLPELFDVIGTRYGGHADEGQAKFSLPDLRGVFLRGLDEGRGLDTDRKMESMQEDMVGPHEHQVMHEIPILHIQGTTGEHNIWGGFHHNNDNQQRQEQWNDTNLKRDKDRLHDETRPINMPVRWIIKAYRRSE